MAISIEPEIQRWVEARIIDVNTAERIRLYERDKDKSKRLSWPIIVALGFGAVMVAAGILLFVAAHWDEMSPPLRFALVLFMVAAFHVGGALTAEKSPQLSIAMHTLGTASLGAGIFLTGEIFNLQEHWPTGVLLWAVGACGAALLLRQWPQIALAAILTPAWLISEWEEATKIYYGGELITFEATLLLAIAYFTSRSATVDGTYRKALSWIGGLALLPAFCCLVFEREYNNWDHPHLPLTIKIIGWSGAILIPVLVSYLLRRGECWPILLAVLWVVVQGKLPFHFQTDNESLAVYAWHSLGPYLWSAAGAIGLIAWGVHDRIKSRINFGMALFAFSLLSFYFSDLLDKLGRSVSLISFGVLFLVCGYFMEKTRRRLIAQVQETA
jgi:uncharacterized membrane protein